MMGNDAGVVRVGKELFSLLACEQRLAAWLLRNSRTNDAPVRGRDRSARQAFGHCSQASRLNGFLAIVLVLCAVRSGAGTVMTRDGRTIDGAVSRSGVE